jgi:hypothetical protein
MMNNVFIVSILHVGGVLKQGTTAGIVLSLVRETKRGNVCGPGQEAMSYR